MNAVDVSHVSKAFVDKVAVSDLSFSVARGEVLGLIGPNGAGKTTTIRMLMEIFAPDSGEVRVLGEPPSESTKNHVGYLPEERGLYRKLRAIDCIVYLATLKGMDRRAAEKRALQLLDETGMIAASTKKVEELSHGMAQLVQFVVTVVHDPDLVVLDEPFQALDPVNAELLRQKILDLKAQGKAIIFSTHTMNDVEELSDRVLMLDHGQAVLYGSLPEIKARFRGNSVLLSADGAPSDLPGIVETRAHKGYVELVLDGRTSPQDVLRRLVALGVPVNRFEVATPSLNEIFLRVVGERRGAERNGGERNGGESHA